MRAFLLLRAGLFAVLTLPLGCVGLSKVEKPAHYKFEAKKGAKLVLVAPGVQISAEGPVTIESSGEALYVTNPTETEDTE